MGAPVQAKAVKAKSSLSSSLFVPTVVGLLSIAGYFTWIRLNHGPYHPVPCATLSLGCPNYPISGHVAEGFEAVRTEFQRNFEEGEEVGASFYAWMDGKPVVELTGGFFDTTLNQSSPYTEDVLQLVFSSGKAVASIAVAHLVSQGHIAYTDKISTYWPEFAQGNKENVTLSDLMGHRSGLSYLDPSRAPSPEDILDLDALAESLAAQPHNFGGRTTAGYHAVTRGWYINEVVRRSDPKKRTLGAYIEDEIAGPLGIDYHLGLDESLHSKVSLLVPYPTLHMIWAIFSPRSWQKEPVPPTMMDAVLKTSSYSHKSLIGSGPKFPWYQMWPRGYNKKEIWSGESPSFGGITNAKSLSRLAAVMANSGVDPVTKKVIIPLQTLETALTPLPKLHDVVLDRVIPFLTGGWGEVEHLIWGEKWVGWAGAGGSMIWWNREENLAFSYAMNAVKLQSLGDKRSWRLIQAFVEGVDKKKGRTVKRYVGDVVVDEIPPPV
ncbi:hypothetical protein HKX48_006265 [Thoreauomyces humboldtii]|nr:hypothetical protein HKX48_006265 [Thoreauomyces humboldtii]